MKIRYKILMGVFVVILLGFLIPDSRVIPVLGGTKADWNADTFWYEPWGSSGVHKGIDIFAASGAPVIASTDLMVLYRGSIKKGGNILLALGPKWRLHYFAHMKSVSDEAGIFITKGTPIGTVGTTGNAKGKQPHLHFSIISLLPMPWLMDGSAQGYQKAFYLNPIDFFMEKN